MEEEIRALLEDALPLVNFDADFLFAELDSLGVALVLTKPSEKYKVPFSAKDVTPKNFKSLASLARMVEGKLA